jgi:hypothetical protein
MSTPLSVSVESLPRPSTLTRARPQRQARGLHTLALTAGHEHGTPDLFDPIMRCQRSVSVRLASRFLKRDLRMTTIYVGNLPFNATEQDVRSLFERHGTVDSVKLINDRETGRPRGFGFVDMPQSEALTAIQALNGYSMSGRPLRVNEAQDRQGGGGGPGRSSRPGGGQFRR